MLLDAPSLRWTAGTFERADFTRSDMLDEKGARCRAEVDWPLPCLLAPIPSNASLTLTTGLGASGSAREILRAGCEEEGVSNRSPSSLQARRAVSDQECSSDHCLRLELST